MANQQKKDIVASLSKTIEDSTNFALVQFEKTSHQSFEDIRKNIKKADAKIQVIKNSLFETTLKQMAQKEKNYKQIIKDHFPLQKNTAILTFKGDWADGLKKFFESVKDNEFFNFKFGYIENETYDASKLNKLATLPSKAELLAQFVGILKSPLIKTTMSMKAPMQKLVFVLNAKAKA